ncbi:MAG: BBP7 family outer membrane beta-barrel protein [Planctomycetota bacterium]
MMHSIAKWIWEQGSILDRTRNENSANGRWDLNLLRFLAIAFGVTFGPLSSLSWSQHPTIPPHTLLGQNVPLHYAPMTQTNVETVLGRKRYQSLMQARIDSVWMSPSGAEFQSEILDPGSGNAVVSQNLDFGVPVAPQASLRSFLLDDLTAELSFLYMDSWESSAVFNDVPPSPNLDAQIRSEASLQNYEANVLSDPSVLGTRWIAGLRYLEYSDSLSEDYVLDSGVGPVVSERAFAEATNRLFGAQFGIELDIAVHRTLLQVGSKVGFFNNRSNQTGPAYADALTIDGVAESTFDLDTDQFTVLLDFDALLQRQLTDRIAIHVGYQGWFLDRVAQSASQRGGPTDEENLWFHGLVLGGQWVR